MALVRLQLCTPALIPQAQTLSWDQHGHIRIAMACRYPQHTPQWTEPSTLKHHALLPPLYHVWRRAEGNQVNNSQPEQDPRVLRRKGGVRSMNQPTVVSLWVLQDYSTSLLVYYLFTCTVSSAPLHPFSLIFCNQHQYFTLCPCISSLCPAFVSNQRLCNKVFFLMN